MTLRAPYRILDCGGWTDTAFMPGGQGACLNVAINLGVEVDFTPNQSALLEVRHVAGNQTESIALPVTSPPETLAQAAAQALNLGATSGGMVEVRSDGPPGSSMGGSAAYCVALLASLSNNLLSDKQALATQAMELETKWLNHSSGTQDQMAASFGGISYSQITYPVFTHEAIKPPDDFVRELEASLLIVYTGEAHISSEMHAKVLAEMKAGNRSVMQAFDALKLCAIQAKQALLAGDMAAFKSVVNNNWTAQKNLDITIATADINSLEHIVRTVDALATFKGVGAGGGGSVCILTEPSQRDSMGVAIMQQFPHMLVWKDIQIDWLGARIIDAPALESEAAATQQPIGA